MRNRIKHFLTGSLALVCIVCILAFLLLSFYLNRQNEQTITDLGNIYMSSMNDRISKHFGSITDHRMTQMTAMMENIPPDYLTDKTALNEWLVYNGQARGYEGLGYCDAEGSLEMVYGDQVTLYVTDSPVLGNVAAGKGGIAMGRNSAEERVVVVYVPVDLDVPGTENCTALVGVLPVSYLADTLSLEDEKSLIYSFVIRKDGSFLVRTSAVVRETTLTG